MRLISICPSNTELLAYLGLTDHLVGLDDFSDWPLSVQHLPKLGPDLSIDIDALEALNPDLVLASLSVPGMEKNVNELVARGIPHLVLDPQSLNDIADDLLTVGKACGIGAKAEDIVSMYKSFVSEMKKKASTVKKTPQLYWEWWPKPIFTPGRINWLTEVSEISGGLNVFRDVELASVQTDWDDVLRRNPDYIFLAWVGVRIAKVNTKVVEKRPGFDGLTEEQKSHLYIMEEELYCRPSPRLLEGALKLANILHPDIYGDLKLPQWVTTND
ncbi:cobalamin-binding protein [Paenisporosarcina antarctica]|uniref:Cobalamin-binding protein n=1 Tax=Paenisporosarcina antarctica TaxID=417367 RepID=A0A4P6ZW76_9BACL|nr:cobalamin-binding protein [Paenisporosarcina antarctica]QBP40641.1 cobalamin-binding protein [Paenisporosarcina antarctica]